MKTDTALHQGIEDIVYAWSLAGQPYDRLVDEIHDYVLEHYGPPF